MGIKSKSLKATSDGRAEEVAYVQKPKTPTKVVTGEPKRMSVGGVMQNVIVIDSKPPMDQIVASKDYEEGTIYVLNNAKKVFLGGKRKAKNKED